MAVCAVELQIQQGMSLKLPFLHISLFMCVCVRFIFTFVAILRTLYQPPQDSRPQFSNPIFMCSHINNNSLHFSSMLSSPHFSQLLSLSHICSSSQLWRVRDPVGRSSSALPFVFHSFKSLPLQFQLPV